MSIDWFHYKLWYNSFPINPINLKLIGYICTIGVNIYINFEIIWTKFYFVSILGLLANFITFLSLYGSGMYRVYKKDIVMVL